MLSIRHSADLLWLVLFSSAASVLFVGLPFSWSEWRKELSLARNARVRVVVTAGVVFVTIQVLMFVALWTPWTSSYLFLRLWRNSGTQTEKENSLEGRQADYTQAKEGTMTGDAG